MFTLRGMLSKDNQPKDVEEDYIQASSVIMDGSIFDRRKQSNDRRSATQKPTSFGEIIVGIEKKLHKERRITIGRRSTDTKEKKAKKVIKLNDVEVLIAEQQSTFQKIKKLSISAKDMEFHAISGQLKNLVLDIKYLLKKEETLLHESLDPSGDNHNEQVRNSLSNLELYINNISDQVLHVLDKHQNTKVTATNVGAFLLDLKSIDKTLKESLEQKQKYLYPLYKQLPDK